VQNSWRLNDDFLDENLVQLGFETAEAQLKLVVNILHALGKMVCFDALPHVDNFSEIVLLNPRLFEWVKLNETKTNQIQNCDYNNLYKDVESLLINYLQAPENLFSLNEEERRKIIFPKEIDNLEQRLKLRNLIRNACFEPVPVAENCPLRPIKFSYIEYQDNKDYAVFDIENKTNGARVIGAVTAYKWYKLDKEGFPIKNEKEQETWEYFANKLNEFQKTYNFDFLRADMGHNQISHSHQQEKDYVTANEFWAFAKNVIQQQKPYFATFSEAFYNTYYIDGLQDMENKKFDIVLGTMNFKYINKQYIDWIKDFLGPFEEHYSFYPSLTIFTNDGDLPIHDEFYKDNLMNKIRYFFSLFLPLPSYMGIGYEIRNTYNKAESEYSNKYVKIQENEFCFGNNVDLYEFISKMRAFYLEFADIIKNYDFQILETEKETSFAWGYLEDNIINLLFIVRLENNEDIEISDDFTLVYADEYCFIYKLNH